VFPSPFSHPITRPLFHCVPSPSTFELPSLPQRARWLLAGLIAAASIGFCTLLLLAYIQVTPPNSIQPDFRALEGLFFGREQPVSLLEQLLEATEGPLNRAGTMRPAFTDKSLDWESLIQDLTAEERAALLAEREGERLALVAWVRSGLNQPAYQADDFLLDGTLAAQPITAKYLITDRPSPGPDAPKHVRIRSILADRCVTCHSENGRNEQARWLPLDTYADIEFKTRPESLPVPSASWLIASLVALLPLAMLTAPLFYLSSTPLWTRRLLTILPFAALAVTAGCWLLGQPKSYSIHLLLAAAALAAISVLLQIIATLADLFANKQAHSGEIGQTTEN
jgi:hypothetical protein